MFGQVRTNRSTVLMAGTVIFLVAFVSLAYNHLDTWEPPTDVATDTETSIIGDAHDKPHHDEPAKTEPQQTESNHGAMSKPDHASNASTELGDYYFNYIMKSKVKPTDKKYAPFGAFPMELPGEAKWTSMVGEELCIIDLDNRPFNEPGQIFSEGLMSWDRADEAHGLSLGVLNHWLYAKNHGYKYYYVDITDPFEDRRNSWKKPPILSKILKKHKACIFLDSDAVFHHIDLPFEWLMNYWQLHPDTNSLALAYDPTHKNNMDKFDKVYLNTGFIVLQNNEKTFEILKEWEDCPNEGGKHPDCVDFRKNRPGKPTDQGGFGTYIRYDYPKDIKDLPCTEANGFPESKSGCEGKFIKHLWTGKKDHIKVVIGQQVPGDLLEMFHKQFLDEKPQFFISERDVMAWKD
ncbi:hypothetical protein FVEN_g5748 [Fusarium venenatum]|uniref:Nucleotide-diphospho-sugar transferase domain-containing protein n=1 Tax=Fusarium venenatum TaxID=56646 RepID=A0A2L2TBD3_9HYPO|nr:uncharacterized protein FVRRES_03880 [Fusarium venenatum]KAG8356516.1 hypothetical protein FVEN_g5748 [Fusarium venenatum]KAH7003141.1 hypothetical protein EDB82DRAFT_6534 [Fusarium venenatum]CEI67368.1 unnamed protein product [Fusarium venenatum]